MMMVAKEDAQHGRHAGKWSVPRPLRLFVGLLAAFGLLLVPRLLLGPSSFARLSSSYRSNLIAGENDNIVVGGERQGEREDRSGRTTAIYCDRTSSPKTDVCTMTGGDVRMHSASSTIFLHFSSSNSSRAVVEKIRPYPRKFEPGIMATVPQLSLVTTTTGGPPPLCDVRHSAPAVVFYAGGYTGNLFHEFLDGIVPLFITSRRFDRQVVLVILKYQEWWVSKYQDILSQLSDYAPIDFAGDKRVHCFPGATVGLRVHGELAIDPSKMEGNETILDFHRLLDDAYRPRLLKYHHHSRNSNGGGGEPRRPRLVIMSRNGSRGVENESGLVSLCEDIGFDVRLLRPGPNTDLATMYAHLNASDVTVGVHGAALTHFLFMRPATVLIQIVPLGNDWVADLCFGTPATKMGLKYLKYGILPEESSLYAKYGKDDPVLRDPASVAKEKGWEGMKEVYLEGQSVKLDLDRFKKWATEAYQYTLKQRQKLD